MHKILPDRIIHDGELGDRGYEVPIWVIWEDESILDLWVMWQEKMSWQEYLSFDDWQKLLDRESENQIFSSQMYSSSYRHISRVSSSEEIDTLREYYAQRWYFTDYPRKCDVPLQKATLTASIDIHHLVYSSKDKHRLQVPYFPPIRSASDQRSILTGLRTGVLIGVQAWPQDVDLIAHLLHEEILSPFLLGRLLCYNFMDRGLPWEQVWIQV